VSPRVLLRRLLGATEENHAPMLAGPGRPRASSMAGLSHQVTVYAAEGASPSEIARRTGLAHDAIALILHFRQQVGSEASAVRPDAPSWGWVADA
jgi:hypothetical protein